MLSLQRPVPVDSVSVGGQIAEGASPVSAGAGGNNFGVQEGVVVGGPGDTGGDTGGARIGGAGSGGGAGGACTGGAGSGAGTGGTHTRGVGTMGVGSGGTDSRAPAQPPIHYLTH
ncbi:unnamed protein product [Closterium sp. NIES-54]